MTKYLTLLILLFLSRSSFSQELDTFEMHCLPGYNEDYFVFIKGIRSPSLGGDNIVIELIDDCSYKNNYVGSVEYRNDTLFLFYEKVIKWTGDSTFRLPYTSMCDCLFELNYSIKGLTHKPIYYFLNYEQIRFKPNRFKTYPVEYDLTLNGDTINYYDEFGLAQGVHVSEVRHKIDNDSIKGEVTHVERYFINNVIIVTKVFVVHKNGREWPHYYWNDYFKLTSKDEFLKNIILWKDATKHNNVYKK